MQDLKSKIIAGLFLILLFTCNKDDDGNPYYWNRDYWGEATALKNGEQWNALIYGHRRSVPTHIGASFSIDVYDVFGDVGFRRETLHFFRVPLKKGIYEFVKSIAQDSLDSPGVRHLYILQDGDVVGDLFTILESEENYIEVLSLEGDEITAEFQVTFVRDDLESISNPEVPDTIRFTNGYFHTRLND